MREFARDLKIMARRFPDVSERQLIQVLFEGVHSYDDLVTAAEHFERGERARTGEDKKARLPPRWTRHGRQRQLAAKGRPSALEQAGYGDDNDGAEQRGQSAGSELDPGSRIQCRHPWRCTGLAPSHAVGAASQRAQRSRPQPAHG